MNRLFSFLVLVAVINLASCSGSGGTVGGLVPAPKFLKGKVVGDTYFSDRSAFKVRLPHPPTGSENDQYEWTYTKVHEINDKDMVGVVFGPAAFDRNVYHAVLSKIPMKAPKGQYAIQVLEARMQSFNEPYDLKTSKDFNLNGKRTFYAVYEAGSRYVAVSLTDNTDNFYMVEIDIPKDSTQDGFSLKKLISKEWGAFNGMLESFAVLDSNDEI